MEFFERHVKECWPEGQADLAGDPGFCFATEEIIDRRSPNYRPDLRWVHGGEAPPPRT